MDQWRKVQPQSFATNIYSILSSCQSIFVARHIKNMQIFRIVRIRLWNLKTTLRALVWQDLGKVSFFFFFLKKNYLSIVVLYSFNFCCTAKWLRNIYIYIYIYIPIHIIFHYGSLDIEYSFPQGNYLNVSLSLAVILSLDSKMWLLHILQRTIAGTQD